MRPIRRESGFAIIDSDESKKLFEATALEELRALHIEEDVARIGTGQAGETFPGQQRKRLDIVGVGLPFGGLQRRLMSESAEGVRLDSGNS
jgi:hypothetical protein